jgi:FkbM family methyltransferase
VAASGERRCELNLGVVLQLDLSDWMQRVYYLGDTEAGRLRTMCSYLPPDGVAVDVGANIGLHTCSFAAAVPQGRVWAFEPLEENRGHLDRNLVANGLDNVEVVAAAAGSATALLDLAVPERHAGGTTAAARIGGGPGWRVVDTVPGVRVDDVVTGRVDLIKIDVQGFEVPVLAGCEKTIARCRPVIVCEISDSKAIAALAEQADYEVLELGRGGRVVELSPLATDVLLVPRERAMR